MTVQYGNMPTGQMRVFYTGSDELLTGYALCFDANSNNDALDLAYSTAKTAANPNPSRLHNVEKPAAAADEGQQQVSDQDATGLAPVPDEPNGDKPAAVDEEQQPVDNQYITDLPPPPHEPKNWPKGLSSRLYRLVLAEREGEAEAFAGPRRIELRDGSVLVTITCSPGQCEAAVEAAINAGAWLGARGRKGFDAVVPITSLIALAETESIRFIALPDRPVTEEPG